MSNFERFKKSVRDAYNEKKIQGELPGKLNSPSPAHLREYSLIRLTHGLSQEDLLVFQQYFNPLKKYDQLEIAIQRADLNLLKSLQNYILGKVSTRSEEIVKLLAVLIDYPKRPYRSSEWNDLEAWNEKDINQVAEEKNSVIAVFDEQQVVLAEPYVYLEEAHLADQPSKKQGIKSFSKKQILLLLLLFLCIMGFILYFNWNKKPCMFWNGANFIEVDCADQAYAKELVVLDPYKVANFHKITRPDTLNESHIGKIWYSKINRRVEFFTLSGHHPVHRDKSLKLLTPHIYKTYINKNANNNAD